jgi:hypothetical protein
MESKDEDEQSVPTDVKPTPSGKGKGKGKGKKKKTSPKPTPPSRGSRTESGNPNPPPAATGFALGNKVLEAAGLGISGRIEEVFSVPNSEKFFQFIDQCYDQLCAAKAELKFVLSRAEWRHIHALFFYGRLQNVEFEQTGKKQPAPTRIPLPYDVRVFQPIWAILADVGVVHDPDLHVRYIPVARMPRTEDQSDAEDISELIECLQYHWVYSWDEAQKDRQIRINAAASTGHHEAEWKPPPKQYTLTEFKKLKRNAVKVLSDLKILTKHDFSSTDAPDLEMFEEATTGFSYTDSDSKTWAVTSQAEAEQSFKAIFEIVNRAKSERLDVTYPAPESDEIQFTLNDERLPNDPGSYGKWLGWDPQLWLSYRRFVDISSPVSLWSPSFPREVTGSYMWLLPVEHDASGIFCRMPKNTIPNPVWLLALILDMSTLHSSRTHTFYVYSDRAMSVWSMTNQYIKAAIQSGAPVEVFR